MPPTYPPASPHTTTTHHKQRKAKILSHYSYLTDLVLKPRPQTPTSSTTPEHHGIGRDETASANPNKFHHPTTRDVAADW